ncbi:MAG: hypothetical protein NC898_02810 [Candidatus Omnitrophica bacterium]|nr:hypothetical protein [Candidatus Omnitrophota bacterium]MCM8793380.1 hypothetical protein [Candidatus Omnitrophota bacterium]
MKRLVNLLSLLIIIISFFVFDYYFINKILAIDAPSALTSWVRALPLHPQKRSIYVEWSPVTNAAWYNLEYSSYPFSTNSPTNVFVGITPANYTPTSYIHNNLSDNNWYVYRVRAVDANGVYSNYSPAHGVAVKPAGLRWEEIY